MIDNNDIKESTRHLDDPIIVLDPPTVAITPSPTDHTDLADILGGDWPDIPQSNMFNSDSRSVGSYKSDRIRSINPINHIASKPKQRDSYDFDSKKGNKKGEFVYF